MISQNKLKKIVDFLVEKKTPYEISRILKIDYKTAKKYSDIILPEIVKATGIVKSIENADFSRESTENPLTKLISRLHDR